MFHIDPKLIQAMYKESCKCVKKNPDLHDHPFLCEAVFWNSLQDGDSYTLHTHTIEGVNYPSSQDKITTRKLGKQNLCIINTVDKDLTCYNIEDNFKVPILQRMI